MSGLHSPLRVVVRCLCSFLLLLCAFIFGSYDAQVTFASEAPVGGVPTTTHIRNVINDASRRYVIDDQSLFDVEALRLFYEARDFEPHWLSNVGPYSRAHTLISTLENSWRHGLNPAHYHADHLRSMVDGIAFVNTDRLEVLLSDAFVRYARDLSGMRVDTSGLSSDFKSWRQRMSAGDALQYLATDFSIKDVLNRIEPQGNTYEKLQAELADLVNQPEVPYASALPITLKNVLRPGERQDGVRNLRMRLDVAASGVNELVYDDALVSAVIAFQREHGLDTDGVVGSGTLQILNRMNRTKAEKIIVNLERLRWVMPDRPDRFVVVNIPAATLWAVDKGRVEFEMPVIVGKPVRPTQSFISEIQGVRFNPDWTIPPTIKRQDILPQLRKNPGYLHAKGIQLLKGYGRNSVSLDPHAIEWRGISTRELNNLRMVQLPGDNNPLGRVRILMPNIYNIYLHDTNHPEYFENDARALSSGCLRMKEPEKMAQFILKNKPGWEASGMRTVLNSRKKTEIMTSETMPVYVLYYTVWTNESGDVIYGADIYNEDQKLLSKLSGIDGFYVPSHNRESKAQPRRSERMAVNQ